MNRRDYLLGLFFGVLAFTMWGLLPLYWKLVSALNPYQLFTHRVMWSFVFLTIILMVQKDLKSFLMSLHSPQLWRRTLAPTLFISINWLTYIWSVNNGFVIEASLGYYINPLVLTSFGAFIFKERLNSLQLVGLSLATIGVVYKTLIYGRVPYLALTLAISFAIYGLLKKKSATGSIKGLSLETLIVSFPAFFYIIQQENSGLGISGRLPFNFWFLIAFSGIATATPLIFYAESAKRLPLSVLGFLQYIAPTLSLALGIFVFKETFTLNDAYAFGFIWLGLIFFSISQYQAIKHMK